MKLDYGRANEDSTKAAYRAFLSKFWFSYKVSMAWCTDVRGAKSYHYHLEPKDTVIFDGRVDLSFYAEYE